MNIKCKINKDIIEIIYKSKTYKIEKKKLEYVLQFLSKIKETKDIIISDNEREIIDKLEYYCLIDENFLENINNIWK